MQIIFNSIFMNTFSQYIPYIKIFLYTGPCYTIGITIVTAEEIVIVVNRHAPALVHNGLKITREHFFNAILTYRGLLFF